jgi:phage-related protein
LFAGPGRYDNQSKSPLTNGFVKKTQKTPPGEMALAAKYKADYERRQRK